MQATLLTITGTLLLVLAISAAIRIKLTVNAPQLGPLVMPPCGMTSPDGSLRCTNSIEHLGWCSADGTEWSGDCWNCDQYAETGAAPTLEASALDQPDTELAYSQIETPTKPEPQPAPTSAPSTSWFLKPWLKSTNPIKVRWIAVIATFWLVASAVNAINSLFQPAQPDMNQFPNYCYTTEGKRKDTPFDIMQPGGTERLNECRTKLGWWGPLGTQPAEQTRPFS